MHAINAGNVATNLSTGAIEVAEVKQLAIHEIYTGSPSGNLLVQSSNDAVNWFTEDTNALSASGNKMVKLSNAGYRYLQVSWTAGGTGSLDVYVSGKI